ncbi:hypothetical protein K502DRAFT_348191 [Neoconidiobolus thromboides FSU 785]|nr:hypothetical protein K502DRAFT_348191 [Neoconidiobolus thromboides FSU 785]
MGISASEAREVATNPVARSKFKRKFWLIHLLILFLLSAACAIAIAFMVILNGADVYLLIPIALYLIGVGIQIPVRLKRSSIERTSSFQEKLDQSH